MEGCSASSQPAVQHALGALSQQFRRELLQSMRLSQAGWPQRWLRQKPKRLEKGLEEDLEEAEVVVLPQQQGAQERAADSTAQLQSRSRRPATQTAS